MNSSHTLKIENKAQHTLIRICTFLRSYILSFINRNTSVFESLSRATTPFGGSSVSSNR